MIDYKFDLYLPDGWLNVPGIAELTRSSHIWLIVIVGARQVGKTYGVLKEFAKNPNIHGMYLRRTVDEMELISSNDDLNPFLPLAEEGIHLDIVKASKKVWVWGEPDEESDTRKIKKEYGLGLSLGTIAQMRGFNGSRFTDIYLDEFIPEKTVLKRKGEGDALLNAYVTINGNRELKGKPPLRMWLTANAFDISSSILTALGLTNEFEKMERRHEEWKILDGGVFLAFPKSEKVIHKRKDTAMMNFIKNNSGSGNFYDMALNNSFAYDSLDLVKPKSIKGYKPYCSLGDLYVWDNGTSLYVCKTKHNSRRRYADTPEERVIAGLETMEVRAMYMEGLVTFSDTDTLLRFRNYYKIKVD